MTRSDKRFEMQALRAGEVLVGDAMTGLHIDILTYTGCFIYFDRYVFGIKTVQQAGVLYGA
jgi:hypothetical protein